MSGIPAGAGSLLGKRLGKYEILALLALGGTAEIYLARIDGTNGFEKYVVVKCLHDHLADDIEFVKMFLDEARLAAHLDHSNIVQTFELGEHESRYFMVMEFLAGLSLAMVVRRAGERLPGGRIPVPLVLNMVAQAAAGLHYAHERTTNGKPLNIVHRDISPQNLVVSFEGVTKVVDFGIAKAEHRETRTRSGTIKGKFAYMSPEQCVANNVDRRTDVFALGVIAHELLTGRRLFKRPSPYETYQAVIECNVGPPSATNHELDPAIDPVIMRAVAKDKEQRYATAEAFGDAIQSYLHHRGKGSGPGDVGRFFEQSFGQEIEEHGARMRELISGREASLDVAVGWGAEEEAEAKRRKDATVDVRRGAGGDQSIDLQSQDIEVMRASEASLDSMISNLDAIGKPGRPAPGTLARRGQVVEAQHDDAPDGEDDMQADRTRIESNPLDRDPEPRPSQAAMPLPAPPTGPHRAAGAAKFPDVANLPTMIADGTLGDAPTAINEPIDPSRLAARAAEAPQRPSYGHGPSVLLSPSMVHAAIEPRPSQLSMLSQPPSNAHAGNTPRPVRAVPNAPGTPARGPGQATQPPMSPAADLTTAPEQPVTQPQGYPQQPPGPGQGSPMHGMQGQPPMPPGPPQGYPPPGQIDSGVFVDPSQAANMMSPVGAQYPNVDWDAAAALPAKAVPPWKLAVFFMGALGIALTLTIVLARMLR